MLTPERLAEIKARCEMATQGPWFPGPRGSVRAKGCGGKTVVKQGADKKRDSDEADVTFIAHARADVPDLLAEVERLRAALAAEREACAKVADAVAAEVAIWKDGREPDFFVPIAEGIALKIRARGETAHS